MIKPLTKAVLQIKINKGKKTAQKLEAMMDDPMAYNRELLLRLLRENADTEYGKKYGFSDIHSVEEFKAKVPFSTYDDYDVYIQRMLKGETDLISAKDVYHYAATSGSVDNPKKIPVVKDAYEFFSTYSLDYALYMGDKHCGTKWKKGRGLNLAEVKFSDYFGKASYGSISGKAIEHYRQFLNILFVSPHIATFPTVSMDLKYIHLRYALLEEDLSFMAAAFMNTALDLMKYLEKNWALLVEDIKNGSISPEIKIPDEQRAILQKDIRPNPARAEALRKEFEKGFHDPIIPRIWKDFAWMGAIGGGGFSTYTEKMRHYLGNIPIYFSIYGASEGLMAVPNRMDTEEMLLIPGNIFFEFIPLGGENSQSTETLTMDQLEKGKDYEIVLTNSSGFCRYRILDAIRVTGFYKNCPTIKFIYRLSQSVNLAGEKTNDEALGWAVKETSKKAGFEVVEYSVYPDTDVSPGRYVVFIEGENFGKDKDIARFRDILEEKLDIANPSLGQKVREGILSSSVLHLLQPETFALYRDLMVLRGISANQLKPVRLIDTTVRQKFFFALIDNEAE